MPETVAQIIGLHKAGHQTKQENEEVSVSESSARNWMKYIKDGRGVNMLT